MNNEEQSQDFEKLQRLLKLKRYEQPHPRYFNDFSGRVLAGIRADKSNARVDTVNNLVSRTPWLRRLWRLIESQPALSGAVATAACGLMVAGVFFMEEGAPQNMNFMAVGEPAAAGGNGAGDNAVGNLATMPALNNNFAATAAPQLVSTVNVSPLPTGTNLFESRPSLQTAPVNFNGPPLLQK